MVKQLELRNEQDVPRISPIRSPLDAAVFPSRSWALGVKRTSNLFIATRKGVCSTISESRRFVKKLKHRNAKRRRTNNVHSPIMRPSLPMDDAVFLLGDIDPVDDCETSFRNTMAAGARRSMFAGDTSSCFSDRPQGYSITSHSPPSALPFGQLDSLPSLGDALSTTSSSLSEGGDTLHPSMACNSLLCSELELDDAISEGAPAFSAFSMLSI